MVIQITQDDIDNCPPHDGWSNPVAMALWRATGRKWDTNVGFNGELFSEPLDRRSPKVLLPDAAYRFTVGKIQAPFSFELEAPTAQETAVNAN